MQITRKRKTQVPAVAAQLLLGIAGLALITFVCFRLGIGLARTGFAYVIMVALVSLLGSFSASVVLSIVAAACLNYFFATPLFAFRIDVPEDIERIAAFLVTSLVVTALTVRRKRVEGKSVESRARLEAAQRIAHVGWWQRDLSTDRVTVSDEVCRILGVRPTGRWLNLIYPEDRARAAEAAADAILPAGHATTWNIGWFVLTELSELFTARVTSRGTNRTAFTPIWRSAGHHGPKTGGKRAAHKRSAFRTFADHATDAFFLLDDHSIVVDVNRQACDGLGYSREGLIGKHRRTSTSVSTRHSSRA